MELRAHTTVTGLARIRGTEIMLRKQFVRATGLAVAGLTVTAGLARAQVTEADVGLNPTYEQTGDTLADVTSTGGFFSARVDFMNPGDYTGGH
jgi:hypothetical protein